MTISSYRKYMIFFDTVSLIFFVAIGILGICIFYFQIPVDTRLREGLFFSFVLCGMLVYMISMIYQIKKYRKENNFYLPLTNSANSDSK